MKDVRQTLLNHRSIRRYEREPITDSQMEFIREAVRTTPTSYNGQQYSVIDVTDQQLKEKLYEISGQKQIKTCSHFLVFCADYHKIGLIAREKGVDMPPFYDTADGLIVGTVDASLAMMRALVAAEAMGLGACCIGYARTVNPAEFSRLLKLPQHVYVVCGLAIGVPREHGTAFKTLDAAKVVVIPDIKPKEPETALFHTDTYSDDTTLLESLKKYDAEITEYNATRSGTKSDNDWASHIISYYSEAMGYRMLEALRERGFDIKQ